MRIQLTRVELHSQPVMAQYALLEISEGGDWRVHLQGLKPESLLLLEELFTAGEATRLAFTTSEGDRSAGPVRVSRLAFGNQPTATLQGLAPLP